MCEWVLSPKLCLTLSNPMDCSPPGSSVHGISQARILEWFAISSSSSSQPRDRTQSSAFAGVFFTTEPLEKPQITILGLKCKLTQWSIILNLENLIKQIQNNLIKFSEYSTKIQSDPQKLMEKLVDKNKGNKWISLMVQWLRLCIPKTGDPGLIPGQGTRSHIQQLSIPHAEMRNRQSQINKYFLKTAKEIEI